jgi:hypothetical protein
MPDIPTGEPETWDLEDWLLPVPQQTLDPTSDR